MMKKTRKRLKGLFAIGLFGVAVNASAIEYMAPGNPVKLRIFESGTNDLVCFSFTNFCDLPEGAYTVKIFNSLTNRADETIEIVLSEDNSTNTLADLNCENGDVAKFLNGVWSYGQDAGADVTVFDKVAMLEEFFSLDNEMLMRNEDSGSIDCVAAVECPFLLNIEQIESAFNLKSINDSPGTCNVSFSDWNNTSGGSPLISQLIGIGEGYFVVDTFPVDGREGVSVDTFDNVEEERACAIAVGCTGF